MRGVRQPGQPRHLVFSRLGLAPPPPLKLPSRKWRDLILRVYHVDPLRCPVCQNPMRVIPVIDDPRLVEKILRRLGVWHRPLRRPPLHGWSIRLESACSLFGDGFVVNQDDVAGRFPIDLRTRASSNRSPVAEFTKSLTAVPVQRTSVMGAPTRWLTCWRSTLRKSIL